MLVGVRQQGQEACALDRNSELALIERLRARDAAGDDLARLGDVALQRGEILVVNVLHALGCEAAELLAARKTATAATAATSTAAAAISAGAPAISATTAATTTRAISTHSHLKFPLRVDAVVHVDARFRASDILASRAVFIIGRCSYDVVANATRRPVAVVVRTVTPRGPITVIIAIVAPITPPTAITLFIGGLGHR